MMNNIKVSIILSLYACEEYLEGYFENALLQKGVETIEFSIIHNNPTKEEERVVDKYRDLLNIIYQKVELESIYKSWNRAIIQSTGSYLACWNVDDLRESNSIIKMQKTLDENEGVGFTYGDIIIVDKFGSKHGRHVKTKEFTKFLGTTGSIGGPFLMWRRSLVKKVGYFDEQFLSGGDFDYTVRLSIFSTGKKTKGILGYFLNDRTGMSTSSDSLQVVERTVVELRYGIWYKIDINYISRAMRYGVNCLYENGHNRLIDLDISELSSARKLWVLFIVYGFFLNNLIFLLRGVKNRFGFKKNA